MDVQSRHAYGRAHLALIHKKVLMWAWDLNYASTLGKRARSVVQFSPDIQKNIHGPRSCPV